MAKHLVPYRDKHAVKEVSLTVFVESQINDYSVYEDLLNNQFNTVFQKFEIVNAQDVTINFSDQFQDVKKMEPKAVGFKFLSYEKGKPIRVFQGIDEEHRSYFTFHELNYVSWSQFSELFQSCIAAIAQINNYIVKAYSLHFLDEFLWNSVDEIPYDKVFKTENPTVPKIVFESSSVDFLLTRNMRTKDEKVQNFLERIQINGIFTGKESGSKVVISHNLTGTIADKNESVQQLISSDSFNKKVNFAHKTNKDMLRGLLTDEIQNKISLNG